MGLHLMHPVAVHRGAGQSNGPTWRERKGERETERERERGREEREREGYPTGFGLYPEEKQRQ